MKTKMKEEKLYPHPILKSYSASDIAEMFCTSAQYIGYIVNRIGIKGDYQYGYAVYRYSFSSDKWFLQWRYYKPAINVIEKELLKMGYIREPLYSKSNI